MTPSIIAALAVAKDRLQDAIVAHERLLADMQRLSAEWNTQLDVARVAMLRFEGEVRALQALVDPPPASADPLSEDALHGRG